MRGRAGKLGGFAAVFGTTPLHVATLRRVTLDERILGALRAGPALRLAILFGSQASGRVHAESDVDVAIVPVDPELTLADELALQDAIARAAERDVDLVRADRADPIVRREIARGRPLLEERPGIFARFAADAMLEYLDMEPLLVESRKRYLRRIARGRP